MSATEPQVQVRPIANIPEKKATAQDILDQVAVLQKQVTESHLALLGAIDRNTVPEMPYSWNVYYIAPDGSREQFTVRKTDAGEYVKSIAGIKEHLAKLGYKPDVRLARDTANDTANGEAAPICGIHNKPMTKRNRKDGSGTFWSCGEKLQDGTWCPYKPKAK